MVFINEYDISDIIAVISALIVVVGGVFAFIKWKKATGIQRAEYINELTSKIREEKDIAEVIQMFEYNTPWYGLGFHGSNIEKSVDKTLSYFSYICYLRKMRIITKKEFMFFKYEVEHLLLNPQVKDYLYNIHHYSNALKTPLSFYYLFAYGKKHNLFDKAFYDKTSWKSNETIYHHYLNF